MFGRLFENLYLKVFVNIVVERERSVVYIELCNKNSVIDSAKEIFETTTINSAMNNFIASYTLESPYSYVSILDKSLMQGAAPTCVNKNMQLYFDVNNSKVKCYKDKWSYFTSKYDLNGLEKEYHQIGIDFVFSSFVILAKFFQDKIDTHMAMFILIEEKYISLSVFDYSELLYAHHIYMEKHMDTEELVMDEGNVEDAELHLEKSIDLDDVDVDDEMDSLDDFGNIEDLDSIEDIHEFSEAKDIEEEFYQEDNQKPLEQKVESFNTDYQRFLLIQNSIHHFYKDEKFKSKFVETVYIADAVGFSPDLKKYLEEEMFLSVYVRHIDLNMELCEMAKAELQ